MVATIEADLDHGAALRSPDLEAVNAALVRLKDATWAVRRRPPAHGPGGRRPRRARAQSAAIEAYTSIQVALSALDRLEVRGRDSAGLHLLVRDHGLDLDAGASPRSSPPADDPLFASDVGPVRRTGASASSTRRRPRSASWATTPARSARHIRRDDAPAGGALGRAGAEAVVLGHTRWASVGIISEANAHPLNARGARPGRTARTSPPRSTATSTTSPTSRRARGCASPPRSPPTRRSSPRSCRAGWPRGRRSTTRSAHGRRRSTARSPSAASAADAPGRLLLALRGSGQALYVGLADGRVRRRQRAVRPGGGDASATSASTARPRPTSATRRHARPGRRASTATRAGTLEGIAALALRRHARCRSPTRELQHAEITTRDIDRGDYPHFLLKEITEAPGVVPQDAAGQARRARRRTRRVRSAPTTLPESTCGTACATARSDRVDRDRAGHRRGRRAGLASRTLDAASAGTGLRVEADARHRAVGLRAARPT